MSASPRSEAGSKPRVAIAVGLFVGVLSTLIATCRGLGYARDEGFYFHAARAYGEWFRLFAHDRSAALHRSQLDAHFAVNHEHPALMKSLMALSNLALGERFDETGTSFRLPAMALAAALVAAVFAVAARRFGNAAGLVAALSLFFMPRVFYQAHLACFDVPITALFFLTVAAYGRAVQTKGLRWPIATALLFGLALDTKHNSWFLPFVFVAHAAILGLLARVERRPALRALARPALTLGAMGALGPAVMYALWPWLWHDTTARLHEYAQFHLGHEYYNMEFLGRNYFEPPMPRAYAWLMTVATVPAVTLVAAAAGVVAAARRMRAELRERVLLHAGAEPALWAIALLACYAPWLRDSTPIFGGTKHWMTAYPFLALFAGVGFAAAVRRLGALFDLAQARWLPWALAVVVLAPSARQALHAHPWGLTAYTPLVGGAPGAATLGLNRGFWGYTTGSLVDYLNREVPPEGRVYIHDTAGPSWDMLVQDGRLRSDIRAVPTAADADFVLYHHEMHMQGQEYQAWLSTGTVRPDVVRGLDGVPVIWAYRRVGPRAPARSSVGPR